MNKHEHRSEFDDEAIIPQTAEEEAMIEAILKAEEEARAAEEEMIEAALEEECREDAADEAR